jgi:hypothetical protein
MCVSKKLLPDAKVPEQLLNGRRESLADPLIPIVGAL